MVCHPPSLLRSTAPIAAHVEDKSGSPGEIFWFGDEPFELPSAGFFSRKRTKARYAWTEWIIPLSTTLGEAYGSSTGLSAPG